MLRTTDDSQHFCGPVDWLQDCGVAFLGENRGRRGFWTIYPVLDPYSILQATLLFLASRVLCAVVVNRMDERIDPMRLHSVTAGS